MNAPHDEPLVFRLPTGTDAWLTGVSALVLLLTALGPRLVQASFAQMFRDFGSVEDLPWFTRLALSGWFGPLVTLPGACVAVRCLFVPRRSWPLAAILVSATTVSLCAGLLLVGLYLPIFSIADKIKAD